MRKAKQNVSADDILDALERLSRHVEALQRDVRQLGERIIPVDDEVKFNDPSPWLTAANHAFARLRGKALTVKDTHDLIIGLDRQLEGAESDLANVRARVVAIANDAYLTADWKEWLRESRG